MKKLGLLLLVFALAACVQPAQTETTDATTTEIAALSEAPETTEMTEETEIAEDTEETEAVHLHGHDFMPVAENSTVFFDGDETFSLHPQYSDATHIQLSRVDNGMQYVLEHNGEGVFVTAAAEERYYRQNLLLVEANDYDNTIEEPVLYLPEDIEVGHTWESGGFQFKILEATEQQVRVERKDSAGTLVLLFEKGKGVVEATASAEGDGVKQISMVNDATANPERELVFFYPDANDDSGELLFAKYVRHTFTTNEVTRESLPALIAENAGDYYNYIPESTAINYLYKGKDNVAYVDFNDAFQLEGGHGYEALFLNATAETVRHLLGADAVYLTVEGHPYEGGHIEMEEGTTIPAYPTENIRGLQ